ncbi:MAG: hypothetical protein H7323_06410 [Frankiales bacterium]|nr:hypothetical protein [Frankiales bacterium]
MTISDPPASQQVIRGRSRLLDRVQSLLDRAEAVFYLVVAMFLLVAGALIIGGTVGDLVRGLGEDPLLKVALNLVEESLLLVIVGELLFTLRLVLTGGMLSGEPFLLIGLVATVRRVVVVTAEVESYPDGGRELTNFLLELALLAALTIAFAVALYLLRRAPGPDLRSDSAS